MADWVKNEANSKLEGNPVLEVYDVNSESHDLIQLADVVAGAIHYERTHPLVRAGKRKPAKQRVALRLMRALELESFDDIQMGKVNILTMTGAESV